MSFRDEKNLSKKKKKKKHRSICTRLFFRIAARKIMKLHWKYWCRSIRPEVFLKKGVLRNFAKTVLLIGKEHRF